jgi:hypothetical protein
MMRRFAFRSLERMMKISGPDVRPGEEFRFTKKPTNAADSTFITVVKDEILVTRRASDLFHLPDSQPVIAHWHGERRTDAFGMTIKELKKKAEEFVTQLKN